MRIRSILSVAVCALLCVSAGVNACSVPVFRYALERFDASLYRAVVFTNGPLSPKQKELADALKTLAAGENAAANVEIEIVDLSAPGAEKPEWTPSAGTPLPWLVVGYPNGKLSQPAWAGPFETEAVRGLFDSPARREIVSRLLKGDSAVFLLLEGGNKKEDDAAEALLKKSTEEMQKTLKLPEVDDDEGPQRLMADLPLKIAFSILRISANDPAEKLFAQTLLNSREPDKQPRPVVFPIFGRGHALADLAGERLSAETLAEAGEFICGACTCTYKEQMPGLDLLVAADWKALGSGKVVQDVPPALRGLPALAEAAAGMQPSAPASAVPLAAPKGTLTAFTLNISLLAVLGAVVLLVVIAGIALSIFGKKRPM
ncbi:MAG TPA: hypothetical protein VGP72_23315 [Planctomycetota bacterium]|jgi:hypothetical protein